MDIVQAIILGIVQGLTEFLPVSSSGHLVIFQKVLGIQEHSLIFDVAVHLGTLASVFTVYFKFIKNVVTKGCHSIRSRQYSPELNLIAMVIVATVPTAVIGLTFKSTFESLFSNMTAVGASLIVTGSILLMTRGKAQSGESGPSGFFQFTVADLGHLNWKKAFIIGLAQSAAIAPGISRSGTTIAIAMLLSLPRNVAAMYSFMLAIPAILGAGVLQLKDLSTLQAQDFQILAVGFAIAYLAGLAGLLGVLHFVKKGRLEVFTAYLWVLGFVSIYWSSFH